MISVAIRKHLAASALLLLVACDISPNTDPVEIPSPDRDDPQAEGAERALLVGAYLPSPRKQLEQGQLSHLTLDAQGAFLLGLCLVRRCEEESLQTGTYALEQGAATGSWALVLTPTEGAEQRFLYEREATSLVLQPIGDSLRFELFPLDDDDEPADREQSQDERARLAGSYTFDDEQTLPGDLQALSLGDDQRFERKLCDDQLCTTPLAQAGTFSISRALEGSQYYLRFATPSQPALDRYAYQLTPEGLRLRRVGTSRWFLMSR